MTPLILPPEDLPPDSITETDLMLRRQLEISTSKLFFEACEGPIQSLLMECSWTITMTTVPMLVIYCSDVLHNWRVLSHMRAIAHSLADFSPQAKIRVFPPAGTGDPFDLRVDERSQIRDRRSDR
ncbi:hypothetical protein IQ254_11785 [Nodosilinea sp. LEGE 07088]|uniref:hypothetical protein n=1 Tax=Nodosilinea sp. LEGE 07088 TaxID=2777968 RepID=UPI00187ED521|nr:hypothetical protein [Nodosilinea sp. LEGE 07088]MBE9137865.1 hypothetical protein [Nodosilinea sp. LEGE 07088]